MEAHLDSGLFWPAISGPFLCTRMYKRLGLSIDVSFRSSFKILIDINCYIIAINVVR